MSKKKWNKESKHPFELPFEAGLKAKRSDAYRWFERLALKDQKYLVYIMYQHDKWKVDIKNDIILNALDSFFVNEESLTKERYYKFVENISKKLTL
jgi:hypothetical protein